MDDFKDNIKGIFRLTLNARKALVEGSDIALEYSYSEYDVIHLFYALISDKKSIVYEVLNKLGVDLDETTNRILMEFRKASESNAGKSKKKDLNFSPLLKEVIKESFVIAHDLGHVYVGTEHILFAMFKLDKIDFIELIKSQGIDYNLIRNTILATVSYPSFLNSSMKQPS